MRPPLAAQVFRYYSVGALSVVIDVGLFQTFVLFHLLPAAAAGIASPIAAAVHFTLNRNWSFRAHEGALAAQAVRYAGVYGIIWAVTVGVVAYCSTVLGLAPLACKGAALAVTLPMGFLGHKFITYGEGVRSRRRVAL